LNCRS